MKIAVIGGGVSGLVATYLLSQRHDVRLFEKNAYFGGHANTWSDADGILGLDTGFIVYNEAAYPRFASLLTKLDVKTQPSDMSFSITCNNCGISYSSRGLAGALASPRGLLNRDGLRFAYDMWKFFRHSANDLSVGSIASLTLGAYQRSRGFGEGFKRHFLVPLAAAVWSMPPGRVDEFPAAFFLRFLHNHGLIGRDGNGWRWRTVAGGSRAYVKAIIDSLGCRAVPSTTVCEIRRENEGSILVHLDGERSERFDAVVLACHADEASALLADASSAEVEALSCFAYTRNQVVLHMDDSLLPRKQSVRASWNYLTDDCRLDSGALSMTYHLNRLQNLTSDRDYCLTVNPRQELRSGTELARFEYSHPSYAFSTLRGQELLRALNGRNGIYFAGAHLGYGFHEDGVESAYEVAGMLGVSHV